MDPLISIIVPIYNVEKYLPDCISSLMKQTYENLHIILVDDGSTDRSGMICDEFAQLDNRIEVIHKENGGLVSARKAGLKIVRGGYVGFVDGDDYIDKEMYKNMIKNLMLTEADFVHTGHYKNHQIISELNTKVEDISSGKCSFINKLLLSSDNEEHMSYSLCTKLFKADFIGRCYMEVPNSQSYGEDLIGTLSCILQGNKVSFLKESHYHYVVRNISIVNQKNDTALTDIINLYRIISNLLKEYNCYDEIKSILENEWLGVKLCRSIARMVGDEFKTQCYGISDMQSLLDKRIVVYGAGCVGRDYYSQISRYSRCKIVAWCDKEYRNIHYSCTNVCSPEVLRTLDFDFVVISVQYERNALQIKNSLIQEYSIPDEKIIWIKPKFC